MTRSPAVALFLAGLGLSTLACNASASPGAGLPPSSTQQRRTPRPEVAVSAAPIATPSPSGTPTPVIRPNIEDLTARCPTVDEIASIDADVSLLFDYDPTAGSLRCTVAEGSADLTQLQTNTYNTLLALRAIEFDEPLPWTDRPLYDWLVDELGGIRFVSPSLGASDFCCEGGRIMVVSLDVNSIPLSIDRWLPADGGAGLAHFASLLIHEARHADDRHPHTCLDIAGDRTLAEMGSYGVQYYFYVWLAEHADPSFMRSDETDFDFYRTQFEYSAHTTRVDRFCGEPTVTPHPDWGN